MNEPIIAVLSGGISREREVSQRSAKAMAEALAGRWPVEVFDVAEERIPDGLRPEHHVVFPALHGVFGEDGGMQELLEEAGFAFAGADSHASRLCMNKAATKAVAGKKGVASPAGLLFSTDSLPEPAAVVGRLGNDLVVKPNAEGSSIGLAFSHGAEELGRLFETLPEGEWLIESRVSGRELTVGLLRGRALGIVEILPESGRYDYESKYTKGRTRFRYPAEVSGGIAGKLRQDAEVVFATCGCRDFARVDFLLKPNGEVSFLEINTIPGLTETSLLPKSASCEGFQFPGLAAELITPAMARFAEAAGTVAR